MPRRLWSLNLAMVVLAGLIFGWLQYHKFQSFGYNALDLGIYTNTVWNLAHGQWFDSSIHDPSYLGDHLEVWLLPLSWLYRIWPSPLVLLWAQTAVIAGSGLLIAKLAYRRLGARAAIIATALWLLHPTVYNVAMYEFHGLVFAWPLALWSILAYQGGLYRQWLTSLGLLLLVREDMSLVVFGWGVMVAVDRRSLRWWLTAGAAGLVWFGVAQIVVRLASLSGQYKYLAFYQWLGSDPLSMLTFPLRHPLEFLARVFSPANWQTVVGLLLSFGLLPIFRWRRLWPVSLIFIQLILLSAPSVKALRIHLLIAYLPFLAWAVIEALAQVRRRFWVTRLGRWPLYSLGAIAIITGTIYGQLIFGLAELPWTNVGRSQTPSDVLRTALDQVAPADRVLTTFNLLPHLAGRRTVYSLNYVYLGHRQYSAWPYMVPGPIDAAVIDWQQLYDYQFFYPRHEFNGLTGPERIEDLLAKNNLRLAFWRDSLAVYSRAGGDAYEPTLPIQTGPTPRQKIGRLELNQATVGLISAIKISRSTYYQIPLDLDWRVAGDSKKPVSIQFTLSRTSSAAWRTVRLLGQGTRPAETWSTGDSWRTSYQLLVPAVIRGEYTLTASVIEARGEYRMNRWRGFGPQITGARLWGDIDLGTIYLD